MQLYVIRHGQTLVNSMKRINAHNNIGINKNGRKQANIAAEELESVNIDVIICSPLKRAKQTCKIINKNKLDVIIDKRLIERDAGSMQFKKDNVISSSIWYDVTKDKIYKNSEGFGSIVKRVQNLIHELSKKYPNSVVMFVTHGDVCKAIYTYFTGNTDVKQIIQVGSKNCEINRYIIE